MARYGQGELMDKAAIKREYLAAADAVRSALPGDDARHESRYQAAKAAYDAAFPKAPPIQCRGWYDLPIARAMWEGDARDRGA